MILAIDVGNSNIVLGGIDNEKIYFTVRLSTDRFKSNDEYAVLIKNLIELNGYDPADMEGSIISTVVPALATTLRLALEKITGKPCMVVGSGLKTGLNILIDNPAQLGSDLLVDSVAAAALYPKPIIVADMGTATTLTVISEKNTILGGAILPGVKTSLNALTAKAAQLQQVSIEAPKRAVGSNTIDCMKSGVVFGNASMLDGMIDRFNEELGTECFVVATGGLAEVISQYTKHQIVYNPNLLLEGLYILYQKNIS